MPNLVYGTSGTSLYEFNASTNTWTLKLSSLPVAGNAGSGAGAWDGTYYYYAGSDNKIYRYDPSANVVTVRNGGAATAGIGISSARWVSDGTFIWMLSNTVFGYYNISSDTFTSVSVPGGLGTGIGILVWDYADNLYAVKVDPTQGNCRCYRFNIPSLIWTAQTAPTAVAGSLPPGFQSGMYSNSKLYVCALSSTSANNTVQSAPMPGGASWTSEATAVAPGTASQPDNGIALDSDRFLIGYYSTYSVSTKAVSLLASGALCVNLAYTTSIQSLFTFYESDGATVQQTPEPVGGSAARFFAGQVSSVYAFALRCAYARNSVQLTVVANPAVDVVAGVELSASGTTGWTNILDLGAFAAGQVKAYYLRITVPNPVTPGAKQFSLLATSS